MEIHDVQAVSTEAETRLEAGSELELEEEAEMVALGLATARLVGRAYGGRSSRMNSL